MMNILRKMTEAYKIDIHDSMTLRKYCEVSYTVKMVQRPLTCTENNVKA